MNQNAGKSAPSSSFDPSEITRPHPALFRYYFLTSLLTGPLFPIALLPLLFKYHTLRYRFDATGVSMSWGLLFRRETHLTYRRIQDIHLTRNLLQRWMGLATVGIQTASGSSGPEMSIEGILEAESLRDYLYGQMRGAHLEAEPTEKPSMENSETSAADASTEALFLLREIRDSLRQLATRRENTQ